MAQITRVQGYAVQDIDRATLWNFLLWFSQWEKSHTYPVRHYGLDFIIDEFIGFVEKECAKA
jgi:hypothetical protein